MADSTSQAAPAHATAQTRPLEAVLAWGQRLKADLPGAIDRRAFLERYYAQTDAEDLDVDPEMRAAAALCHLRSARTRKPKTAMVRVFNPTLERDGFTSEHTIVQTVTDDMPFLVTSATIALNASSRGIHVTIHPILQVERTAGGKLTNVRYAGDDGKTQRESFMHFEITRESRPETLQRIEQAVETALGNVRVAVEDWAAMLAKLRDAADEVAALPDDVSESVEFLRWLADNHFTLLGYCEFDLIRGRDSDKLVAREGTGLGVLRDGVRRTDEATLLGHAREEARSKNPLVVTKANAVSTVHRPAPLDYVAVKIFDAAGRPCAERRFLGLFTSVAYSRSPREIPLLRTKVQRIIDRSGFDPHSHRGKALQHILDTLPRDDLIQSSTGDLERISLGILGLQERHRVRLFCRRDAFERFYSCLVYLPRDQYNTRARQRIEAILLDAFDGSGIDSRVTISDSALARLELTIKSDQRRPKAPDVKALEQMLQAAVRSWADAVREELLATLEEDLAATLFDRFAAAFPAAYQETIAPQRAVADLRTVADLVDGDVDLRMTLRASDSGKRLRFTTFQKDRSIQLYQAHPILERMGLRVISEDNYPLKLEPRDVWIQDFELEAASDEEIDPATIEHRFSECFARTLHGEVENDGFNTLVVKAGLDWRGVALLRTYCKYILQTSRRFSQRYMQEVLACYPAFCCALLNQFAGRFNPDLDERERKAKVVDSERVIAEELERTVSLDDDRILRAFSSTVQATLRTNFYQLEQGAPKSYISIKFDARKVPDLPKPLPMFEIFVYSQRVEGVHLRSSTIARGGIRWSDRREDFRTEILGLMKAQQVKNTVIVPTGAKGGFVCKALPGGERAAVQAEVVDCYKTLIRGLLDITDNVVGDRIVGPDRFVARDEPDPYLVVAADKGTATFSDIANALAADYGFWLGDAFASGGSAGYDHKKMAITARGAWEAVKRHFREIAIDTQSRDFTAIGIGDMSGDVFGNGMLLSEHIRLLAAFNHQHIFIDPNPDPARSLVERRRLFELPRSSWEDYDREALSIGGGIYSRTSKAIELHPAAQSMLKVDSPRLTPPELIRAILTMPADLLWNGGIGTYVKARAESHADAGDPANDNVRVDAKDLKCRVVGEGGNLGFTQLGRIEYALGGGRINTDFIDNSGGVDSSDREVNIKILLNDAINQRKLARNKRDALLASMTDTVAELVLANNYGQTQALSMMASRAAERLGEHGRLIRMLEGRGLLDRQLEFLPGEDQLEERRQRGLGLTRPELAVILSYSKIELATSLVKTDIPEDRVCAAELEFYFPSEVVKRFKNLIYSHRLRREIVAMLISSSMINRMGPFFVLRAQEDTGATVAEVARSYAIVREILGVRKLWREIEALDLTVRTDVQYDSVFQISRMVRRAVYWLLQRFPDQLDIETMIARLGPGVDRLAGVLPSVLGGSQRKRFEQDARQLEALGMPAAIARNIATLTLTTQMLDIVELAGTSGLPVERVAQLHFELGRGLRLDWLREQIEALRVAGRWRAMARATLRENLAQEQRALVQSMLLRAGRNDPAEALTAWMSESKTKIARVRRALDDMHATGQMDFATLSVALKEIGRLV
jgi:glutamate dehydrogenase